jgi:hypothetical protein
MIDNSLSIEGELGLLMRQLLLGLGLELYQLGQVISYMTETLGETLLGLGLS